MQRTRIGAEKRLERLKDQFREIEEQMLALFSQVADYTINTSQNTKLGKLTRSLFDAHGGADSLQEQYNEVAAYHNNNFLPLLWNVYRHNRSAILNLIELLGIQSGSQDHSLTEALDFVLAHRDSRKKYLPYDIELDFMTPRWLNYVEAKEAGVVVLNRRELEIAVIFHVADGLRYGDLFVPDSE